MRIDGEAIVHGRASGEVIHTDVALSMMGGTDPLRGVVIDTHHPLHGRSISGAVLVLPGGRGSCSGSAALFEMLMSSTAPAALVVSRPETILALGSIIAQELFDRSLPILRVDPTDHDRLRVASSATVSGSALFVDEPPPEEVTTAPGAGLAPEARLRLGDEDRRMLAGERGPAAQAAMRIVCRAAELEGAQELLDVEMAHIDGNFYQGPGSVAFARRMEELGARVAVPSTMNAIRVDRRRWPEQGVSPELGEASETIAEAYLAMGVSPSYTCAPYLLESRPSFGQQIGWAESNAVVFANSVLGARTLKHPDYLDLMVAITGRAPASGPHLPEARRATVRVDVDPGAVAEADDSLLPLLGYLVGSIAQDEIPAVSGLEALSIDRDDLRAFGAAFATTSSAPMFHVVGHTPEAPAADDALAHRPADRTVEIGRDELRTTWNELNSSSAEQIDLIALGNPHFSLTEAQRLAELCEGRRIRPGTRMIVTCGRQIRDRIEQRGILEHLERFGAEILTDTCWCLIGDPVVPPEARGVMTNSAKYAHYGPAAIDRGLRFGSLAECTDAAVSGTFPARPPAWLG